MVKILKVGEVKPQKITCDGCKAELEVFEADWQKGDYGGEQVIKCPCCKTVLVRPGYEYLGDF